MYFYICDLSNANGLVRNSVEQPVENEIGPYAGKAGLLQNTTREP